MAPPFQAPCETVRSGAAVPGHPPMCAGLPPLGRVRLALPGLRVLSPLGLPSPEGVERLDIVVLGPGAVVVVETAAPGSVACLEPAAAGSATLAEEPCRPLLDASRRLTLLRETLMANAREVLPRRLLPGRVLGALRWDSLAVPLAEPVPVHEGGAPRAGCDRMLDGPAALVRRLGDLLAQAGALPGTRRLDEEDLDAVAAFLRRIQVPLPDLPLRWEHA